ncbi:MAG: NgoPII family restriction endonuclease [Bacteroidaceae bacterium]|nr:NgoPII family restriction endonuclease [Bacteroidaceae bacterium]
MGNIINAIVNIAKGLCLPNYMVQNPDNRTNAMGDMLEMYIKDAFASVPGDADVTMRNTLYAKNFAYLGNNSNPPDAMLKNGGDAIEMKKVQSMMSALALNSSHPHDRLHKSDKLISCAARDCEDWDTRDLIYAVGVVEKNHIQYICLAYGSTFCADESVYLGLKKRLQDGIKNIPAVTFAPTKELGRINAVDPLKLTCLRMRGMWHIETPIAYFKQYHTVKTNIDKNKAFNMEVIIPVEKYAQFPNTHLLYDIEGLVVEDINIPNPNNPALLMPTKLISFNK